MEMSERRLQKAEADDWCRLVKLTSAVLVLRLLHIRQRRPGGYAPWTHSILS